MNYEFILGVLSLLLSILITATVFTMRRVMTVLRKEQVKQK
jgi:hypothetical protein